MACVVFGHALLRIYSPSEAVIAAGISRFHIVAATYFLCGLMDGTVGVLRGLGYSVLPTVVTLIGSCGLRLAWIFLLFQIPAFPHGHGRLSLLSCVVDCNLRGARRWLPLGYKEGGARARGEDDARLRVAAGGSKLFSDCLARRQKIKNDENPALCSVFAERQERDFL